MRHSARVAATFRPSFIVLQMRMSEEGEISME